MRCAVSLAALLLVALGCGASDDAAPHTADDEPEATEPETSETPEAEGPAGPDLTPVPIPSTSRAEPAHRVRGQVRGAFEPEATELVAGAPIVLRFWAENGGETPIQFQSGGDYFGFGPARYTWVAWGPDGEVECDIRANPIPMAGGGGQTVIELPPGERFEEWVTPQPGCDALMRPGRHRLRVVRILTNDGTAPASGCSSILVPDTTVDPIDDRGRTESPECVAWYGGMPAVATELEIDVRPYDAAAVQTAGAAALAIENERRDSAVTMWGRWLTFRIDSEPEWGAPLREWLPALLAELPDEMPGR